MAKNNQATVVDPTGKAGGSFLASPVAEPKSAAAMSFGLIYDSADRHVTGEYLYDAIPRIRSRHFDVAFLRPNFDIQALLDLAAEPGGANPEAILHELGARGLPRNLTAVSTPTAILDIDTFGWLDLRLKWAMLFDYVFTWHPSYVRLFQEAGHPRVFALPHAVDARYFPGADLNSDRPYEVGFVGHSGRPQHAVRDRVNAQLAKRFLTNDFGRRYSKEETPETYRRSRIVVNVSRSEFPQEANMRCFVAMAGGALLITRMPTELTEWGFREREHFIGWRSEEEIPELVEKFLRQSEQRLAIARAGQELTLKDFTYQRCIETITDAIRRDEGQLFAPARQWPAREVHLLYLSYYHRYFVPGAVMDEFQLLRRLGARAYWRGLPLVLRTQYRVLKSSLL